MAYIILSKIVCVIHLLFPFYSIPIFKWVIGRMGIGGCCITQWALATLIFIAIGSGIEIFDLKCPLTMLEKWLMVKGGLTPYKGNCMRYYSDYLRSILY